jgi:hypothetical protein
LACATEIAGPDAVHQVIAVASPKPPAGQIPQGEQLGAGMQPDKTRRCQISETPAFGKKCRLSG